MDYSDEYVTWDEEPDRNEQNKLQSDDKSIDEGSMYFNVEAVDEELANKLLDLSLTGSVTELEAEMDKLCVDLEPKPKIEPQKVKLVQQHLALLLHTLECRRSTSSATSSPYRCDVSLCPVMKTVLGHVENCIEGKDCPTPHCPSSKIILYHWRHCQRPSCQLCQPLRQSDQSAKLIDNPSCSSLGTLTLSQPASSLSPDWHQLVIGDDLRNEMVGKVVEAIFPKADPQTLMDPRMSDLLTYARKVENDKYCEAHSLEEYHQLMSQKVDSIRQQLEQMRVQKNEQMTSESYDSATSSNGEYHV